MRMQYRLASIYCHQTNEFFKAHNNRIGNSIYLGQRTPLHPSHTGLCVNKNENGYHNDKILRGRYHNLKLSNGRETEITETAKADRWQ